MKKLHRSDTTFLKSIHQTKAAVTKGRERRTSSWSCYFCHKKGDRRTAKLDIHDRLICVDCADECNDTHVKCDICLRYYGASKHLTYLYHSGDRVCPHCETTHCATCMACDELFQRDTDKVTITTPDGRCICDGCYKEAEDDADIPDDHDAVECPWLVADDFVWFVRAARDEAERLAQWEALLVAGQMPLPGLEDIAYRPTTIAA